MQTHDTVNELAMSIASGLLGYIGGAVKTAAHQKGEEKKYLLPRKKQKKSLRQLTLRMLKSLLKRR